MTPSGRSRIWRKLLQIKRQITPREKITFCLMIVFIFRESESFWSVLSIRFSLNNIRCFHCDYLCLPPLRSPHQRRQGPVHHWFRLHTITIVPYVFFSFCASSTFLSGRHSETTIFKPASRAMAAAVSGWSPSALPSEHQAHSALRSPLYSFPVWFGLLMQNHPAIFSPFFHEHNCFSLLGKLLNSRREKLPGCSSPTNPALPISHVSPLYRAWTPNPDVSSIDNICGRLDTFCFCILDNRFGKRMAWLLLNRSSSLQAFAHPRYQQLKAYLPTPGFPFVIVPVLSNATILLLPIFSRKTLLWQAGRSCAIRD